jgi:hypothetical protein
MLNAKVPTKGSCPDPALQRAGSSVDKVPQCLDTKTLCMILLVEPRNNDEPLLVTGPKVLRSLAPASNLRR